MEAREMSKKEYEIYFMYHELLEAGIITEDRFNTIIEKEFEFVDCVREIHEEARKLIAEGISLDNIEIIDDDDIDLLEAYKALEELNDYVIY